MIELNRSATFEARRAQMFPVLTAGEVERLRRFAVPRRYTDGELLFETGKPSPGMLVVLSGTVRITGRDGRGHDVTVVQIGPRQFSGEAGSLSGNRAFVDGRATGAVETLLITPERLRAALIAEAELGERIMRALILRRVALIETGAGGPVLIGSPTAPGVARLRNFLARNGIPHMLLDPAADSDAQAFVEHYAPGNDDMPLVACPDGSVLRNPAESVLGRCIGMLDTASADEVLRRRHRRRWPGRACDRGLRGFGWAVGRRRGRPRFRRAGGRQRAHRELPWFPNRYIGHGARGARLYPGAKVRRAHAHTVGDRRARLRSAAR